MTAFRGQQGPNDGNTQFNAYAFMMQQMIGRMNIATLVEVIAVTNDGGDSPVGFVDVRPLVNQVDGNGNAQPHETVHNLPYFRYQGGANAVILDPQIGDIGMAAIADHDISSVKENKGQANPGSGRRNALPDGMYFGGFLNGTPTQFVRFSTSGIEINSPSEIKLEAPKISLIAPVIEMNASTSVTATTPTFTINGNAQINGGITQGSGGSGGNVHLIGPVTVDNDVTAAGQSLDLHIHDVQGVQGGSSTLPTTAPV